MVQDLDSFLHTSIRYGSGLTLFSAKNYSLWFRTWNFFPFFFHYGSGVNFFSKKFLQYGSGLKIFFSTKNLFAMPQDLIFFFLKNFFSMVQDLDFFLQKFIRYGSGLRFFSAKIYFLWFRI